MKEQKLKALAVDQANKFQDPRDLELFKASRRWTPEQWEQYLTTIDGSLSGEQLHPDHFDRIAEEAEFSIFEWAQDIASPVIVEHVRDLVSRLTPKQREVVELLFFSSKSEREVVGASYLRDGQKVYTLRLWMFPDYKFYLMADQEDSTKMLILTRELKRNPNVGKGKFFWNLIGKGVVDPSREVIRLDFDLIEKPIYMSIFPSKTHSLGNELGEVFDAS